MFGGWRDCSATSKEHFSRALLPRCGIRARPAGGKEGAYLVRYPALRRSVPRRTRDEAARAGLHNFAPSQKRTGLVNRRFGRLDFLKRTALNVAQSSADKPRES